MKRKKLTVNTLAVGNLKQRKKQYFILIIGIMLAMIFSSSVLFFMFSASETYNEQQRLNYGAQDAIVYADGFSEDDYKTAVSDNVFTDYGLSHTIGYAYSQDGEEYLGSNIAWLDDEAKKISYQNFEEGSYPQNEDEIAVEKNALSKLGYSNAKIGDTISLKVKVQNGDTYLDTVTKEYKLVGIVTDKKRNITPYYSNGEYDKMVPAIFVAQNTQTQAGGKEKLVAYIDVNKDLTHDDVDDYVGIYDVIQQYVGEKTETFDINDSSAWGGLHLGAFSTLSDYGSYIFVIALVLIFACCIAIINAFNTNLKERKKQIGLLRAVGTTHRQIINIFGREAFIICLICTPISILISYFVVKILLSIVSDNAIMTKSLIVLPIAAVVNICITMLSALIPLVSASKISPMQAIRNINNNRKVKVKKIKSKKQFKAPRHIAKRNLIFYKGSTVVVSVMLIATILFSCLGFSVMSYVKNQSWTYDSDYQIEGLSVGAQYGYIASQDELTGLTEGERQEINALDYVSETYGQKSLTATIVIDNYDTYYRILNSDEFIFSDDGENVSIENLKNHLETGDFYDSYYETKSTLGVDKEIMSSSVVAYDDSTIMELENHLIDGQINYNKLASGEEIILCAPQKVQLNAKTYKDNGFSYNITYDNDINNLTGYELIAEAENDTFKVGDKIKVIVAIYNNDDEGNFNSNDITKIEKEYTIGAIVSPSYIGENSKFSLLNYLSIITDIQGINAITPLAKYSSLKIDVDNTIDDEINTTLSDEIKPYAEKYDGYFASDFDRAQEEQKSVMSMYTTMLAVIIIGFAICASIINNSISARIRENKRTIGTLRAVGASESELVKTYIIEMLSMFKWGVGIGYALFIMIFIVAKIICAQKEITLQLSFNPWITVVMTLITFAVCSINLWSKIRKEMKYSIVENIREL